MVWKLLRKNISTVQIAGYALANLIGLTIVICAIRFYSDVSAAYRAEDSFVSRDYMIISRPVSTLSTIGLKKGADGFSDDDIAELRRQPWLRRAGAFTAADFQVQAAVNLGGAGVSTYLFLESIPDDFLDVRPDSWSWQPGQPVPVIMSREYLTLYNFGFAASRGLPQLSEGIAGSVPLTLTLGSGASRAAVSARIVGFSSRLNTIAVPAEFMQWANSTFADGNNVRQPSRLILELSKPGDPEIQRFMKRHDYIVAGDRADNSRATYFLRLITAIVIAIGAVISLLAFFILTLSIFLLLQKTRTKLHNLMLLGYSPSQVAYGYYALTGIVNGVILLLCCLIMTVAAHAWQSRLAEIGVQPAPAWPALSAAVAIVLAVTAANVLTIRHIVRKAF